MTRTWHYDECWKNQPAQTMVDPETGDAWVVGGEKARCICSELQACERRVEKEQLDHVVSHQQEWIKDGYTAGLNAAFDAVRDYYASLYKSVRGGQVPSPEDRTFVDGVGSAAGAIAVLLEAPVPDEVTHRCTEQCAAPGGHLNIDGSAES